MHREDQTKFCVEVGSTRGEERVWVRVTLPGREELAGASERGGLSCLPRWWWPVLFGGQCLRIAMSGSLWSSMNGEWSHQKVLLCLPEQQGLGDRRGLGRVVSLV